MYKRKSRNYRLGYFFDIKSVVFYFVSNKLIYICVKLILLFINCYAHTQCLDCMPLKKKKKVIDIEEIQ